jgi:hypothetical protein
MKFRLTGSAPLVGVTAIKSESGTYVRLIAIDSDGALWMATYLPDVLAPTGSASDWVQVDAGGVPWMGS